MEPGERRPRPQGSSGLWRAARAGREKSGFEPSGPPGLSRDDLFSHMRGHQQLMISGKRFAFGLCERFLHSWGQGKIDRGLGRRGGRGVPLGLKLQPARPRTFPLPGSAGPRRQLHPGPAARSSPPLPPPRPAAAPPTAGRWDRRARGPGMGAGSSVSAGEAVTRGGLASESAIWVAGSGDLRSWRTGRERGIIISFD